MEQQLDLQTTYSAILEAARNRRYISYGDLAKANGATWNEVRFELYGQLGDLMELAAKRRWPIPSSIVVNQANVAKGTLDGTAREGFISAARDLGFDVHDPEAFVKMQQQLMFEWALDAPDELDLGEQQPSRRARPTDRGSCSTLAGSRCLEDTWRRGRTPNGHGPGD